MSAMLAADQLRGAGLDIQIVDKARGVGGRMATRRIAIPGTKTIEVPVDFGAQFFTARTKVFQEYIADWIAAGVAAVWHSGEDGLHPRYRGAPYMQSVAAYLAEPFLKTGCLQLDTRVTAIRPGRTAQKKNHGQMNRDATQIDGWRIDCESGKQYEARSLILTAPVPQCLNMLAPGDILSPAIRTDLEGYDYHPCFALLLVYDHTAPNIPAPGYATNSEHPELTGTEIRWLADNRQKGVSRTHTALTVHATTEFSRDACDETPETIHDQLLDSSPVLRGIAPIAWQLHRWRYSESQNTRSVEPESACYAVPGASPLILAGDAFGGGRVEGAAISGLAAAKRVRELLNFES